jgi:hypothetical protein
MGVADGIGCPPHATIDNPALTISAIINRPVQILPLFLRPISARIRIGAMAA